MPVTLIEGMAVGLPIACSDRGPMPEVLDNGGVYFDPEDYLSIADAIEKNLCSSDLRSSISKQAKFLSLQYNWKQCSDDTFEYISKVYKELNLWLISFDLMTVYVDNISARNFTVSFSNRFSKSNSASGKYGNT
jgi:hypothetical protein